LLIRKFGFLTRAQFAELLDLTYDESYPYLQYALQGQYCVWNDKTDVIKLCSLEDKIEDKALLYCMDVVCALRRGNNVEEIYILDNEEPPYELLITTRNNAEGKFYNICYFEKGQEDFQNYKLKKLAREDDVYIVCLEHYNEDFIQNNENEQIQLFAWKNEKGEIQFYANKTE